MSPDGGALGNVRFFLPLRTPPESVLETASGIFSESLNGRVRYRPTGVWLGGDRTKNSLNSITSGFVRSSDVALVDVPSAICDALAEACTQNPDSPTLISDHNEPLVAWLNAMTANNSNLIHEIRRGPANEMTTTVDETGAYIGLHLDNWDGLPLEDRHEARNRVCINIGPAERYLLVVPTTITECIRNGILLPEVNHGEAKDAFFSVLKHPSLVRVRVSPGQAYIAPTENIIHDASTDGVMQPTYTLTARGFFELIM